MYRRNFVPACELLKKDTTLNYIRSNYFKKLAC